MSFLSRFFNSKQLSQAPSIRFGRFTDLYRTPEQEEAFETALTAFANEEYLKSYAAFFAYLYHPGEQNVRIWEENNELRFEFFQGSKRISGYANVQKLYAEAKVAKAKTLCVGFMRRLLEDNFDLKYSRYALTPDNEIAIVFDTYTMDGSPYKLYKALQELATHADKQDDILVDEFEALQPVGIHVRRALPDREKCLKYDFIVSEIQKTFTLMDEGKLSQLQYPPAFTYLLLSLCYKLDYLTKPEGFMMETLERIHRLAYDSDGKNAAQKNQQLRKEFQTLLDRPKDKFFKEMYEVSATFGITEPVEHSKVALIIEQELPNMKWYQEQGYEQLALAVPGYIAGRCLFEFALPEPDKALLHLYFEITEAAYFESLGFPIYLKNNRLNLKAIRKAVSDIRDRFKKNYPLFKPDTRMLVDDSMAAFAESYLWMTHQLDLTMSQ
jgi:hypothetical protein